MGVEWGARWREMALPWLNDKWINYLKTLRSRNWALSIQISLSCSDMSWSEFRVPLSGTHFVLELVWAWTIQSLGSSEPGPFMAWAL